MTCRPTQEAAYDPDAAREMEEEALVDVRASLRLTLCGREDFLDEETHIEQVVALKGKGSGPASGIKFMISDAGDYFTDLSKKLKAGGGKAMTAEELKAMDAAAAKAKREKEAKEQAERDLKDAENAKKSAEMEAQGKKVTGGLHKFDASEVDVNGGDATADDFMDAFGF